MIADDASKHAAIIDPVLETFDRDLTFIQELNLDLKYSMETHIHADHITAADKIRQATGAKTVVSEGSQVKCADVLLKDGDFLHLGELKIKAIATPGHTNSCMSFFVEDRVFTGDALLIRGCGRTDFQEGSSTTLFQSVRDKLFKLPESTLVYPAHNYRGETCSSILEEKRYNPRLKLENTLEQFEKIMSELKLPPPQQIEFAVPRNLECGKNT